MGSGGCSNQLPRMAPSRRRCPVLRLPSAGLCLPCAVLSEQVASLCHAHAVQARHCSAAPRSKGSQLGGQPATHQVEVGAVAVGQQLLGVVEEVQGKVKDGTCGGTRIVGTHFSAAA